NYSIFFFFFRGADSVTALYGETILIPCNDEVQELDDLMFIKWKYQKDDGTPGDLLIKQARNDQATVQATDGYAQRISIDDKFNLLITQASLTDQKTFTCMVVSESNLMEFSVSVFVHSVYAVLCLVRYFLFCQVGTCVATDANPAAMITWKKNGKPLVADGKAIVVTTSLKLDPASGLATTSSILQYVATKEDVGVVFTCMSTHELTNQEIDLDPLPIHYPPEKITLEIVSKKPFVEGDNVTMKCQADGNPPPSSFFFHIKGQKTLVENSDTYTLTAINREATGEYKCSLSDNEKTILFSLVSSDLDLSLSPTGKIVKTVGDTLSVKIEKSASGDTKVSWAKNGKTVKEPAFSSLTYADTGVYLCEVSMGGLTRRQSFELVVEGKPVITGLTKRLADDATHNVLTCEAEGVPKPFFQWSVNSTNEESTYVGGKATQKIIITPKVNLTVSCVVSNRLGEDVQTINVSSVLKEDKEERGFQEDSEDQAKLIVGIVAGLLIAAAVMGLIYWLYMKNSRQGSWKTGEKDDRTSEESQRLEENHHTV
uniref:CD166 antigen homolog A-like n=1 Tax=Echeneis naucrates TaxID=173247 RepID=A0A665TNL8_ECHNA